MKEVRWRGAYPELSGQQILVEKAEVCYLVDLAKADKIVCKRNVSESGRSLPAFCFKQECRHHHDSYIRLTEEMKVSSPSGVTETWSFFEEADAGTE